MNFQVWCMDAVEWLRKLPAGSVHCIVTDPAYESLEKHRAVGTTTRLTGEWFEIFPNARFDSFFEAAYAALAKDAHLYVICDQETMFVAKPAGSGRASSFGSRSYGTR